MQHIALVVAAPLGAMAASEITNSVSGLFNFDFGGLELPLRVIIREAVMAVPLIAVVWPVWRGRA